MSRPIAAGAQTRIECSGRSIPNTEVESRVAAIIQSGAHSARRTTGSDISPRQYTTYHLARILEQREIFRIAADRHRGADRSVDRGPRRQATTAEIEQLVGGRYVLGACLGEGGMGSIMEAECTKLGKTFAIKRMHEDLQSDRQLRDFVYREARLASSLSHPNIDSVVDFSEDPTLIGSSVFTKKVLGFDPDLPASLDSVNLSGELLTRRIAIPKKTESHTVYISLTPQSGEAPHVLMLVQRVSKNS